MVRKRWKRKSGYVSPKAEISKKELLEEDLFIRNIYDDWLDWRDGFRDWFRDYKLIKKIPLIRNSRYKKRGEMNCKQKKLAKIRKARQKMKDTKKS